jgi:hypothetical protein
MVLQPAQTSLQVTGESHHRRLFRYGAISIDPPTEAFSIWPHIKKACPQGLKASNGAFFWFGDG